MMGAVAIVGVSCGGDGSSGSGEAGPSLRPTEPAATTIAPTSSAAATATSAPTETSGAAETTVAPPTTAAVTSPLPAVDVLDVATGDTVNFASLIPADRPVLLWFWAPH